MSDADSPRLSICCYAQNAYEKVAWQITDRCHLRCGYCFTPALGRADLDANEACGVVDRIKMSFPWKRRLLFAGREPLLYPHLIEVARHASKLGFICSISTSGELLTAERAGELASAAIYKVNVTINAADEDAHRRSRPGGSLAHVIAGLRAAADHGIVTKVNLTAMRQTLSTLPATLRFVASLPVSRVTIGLLHPATSEERSAIEQLRREVFAAADEAGLGMGVTIISPPSDRRCADDYRCPVRSGLVSVLPDGTFVGCNIYPRAFEVPHDCRIVDGHARPDRRAPAGV